MICNSCGETYYSFLHVCPQRFVEAVKKAQQKRLGEMSTQELAEHNYNHLTLTADDLELMHDMLIGVD